MDQSFINLGVDISNDDTASEKGNVEELGSDHENGNGMAITNHIKKNTNHKEKEISRPKPIKKNYSI